MIDDVTIDLPECRLCATTHKGLQLRRYAKGGTRPHPFATHWYTCPVTGEPYQLTVCEHDGRPLDQAIVDRVVEMVGKPNWMMVTGWVNPDGTVTIVRRTHEFEREKFAGYLAALNDDLKREYDGALPEAELPVGQLPGNLKLFSKVLPGPGRE